MDNKANLALIICIINTGFTDLVMDAARKEGASGGTVLHARGTGHKEIEKTFGITIQPEKELVMIVVSNDKRDQILTSIYNHAGLETKGQGIAFSLPLDAAVGLPASLTAVGDEVNEG